MSRHLIGERRGLMDEAFYEVAAHRAAITPDVPLTNEVCELGIDLVDQLLVASGGGANAFPVSRRTLHAAHVRAVQRVGRELDEAL